jgi:integrase
VRAPEASEVQALLAAADAEDLRLGVFLRVLAARGMCRGEACTLRWSNLDLVRGVISVDEGVIAAKGGAMVNAPKTRASVRSLACEDFKRRPWTR